MNFNKLLKFTLSGLVLAATATAYAQGEGATEPKVVTLGDGTQKTWTDFVNALNDPTTIKGTVSNDVQKAFDDALAAYNPFVTARNDAQDAYNKAQENYTTLNGKYTEAQQAYKTALTTQSEKAGALKDAKTKFAPAEKTLADMNEALATLKEEKANLEQQLRDAKTETIKVPVDWLQTAFDNATNLNTAISTNTSTDTKIYYKKTQSEGGYFDDEVQLTVSFTNQEGYVESSLSDFVKNVMKGSDTINALMVYFGKNADNAYNYTDESNGILSVTSYTGNKRFIISSALDAIKPLLTNDKYTTTGYKNQEQVTSLDGQIKAKQTEIDNKQNEITEYTKPASDGVEAGEYAKLQADVTAAQTAKDEADEAVSAAESAMNLAKADADIAKSSAETAKSKWDTAESNLTAAKVDFDEAKAVYDTAVAEANSAALGNYKDVTLTDNVTATTAIKDFDGAINGNGKVITVDGPAALFSKFNGSLSKVAVNGTIFGTPGPAATYSDVAYWNGTSGAFRDESNNRTSFDKLSKLGYAAREYFGVDFANGKLAPMTDESVVYNITEYGARNYQRVYYVQKNGDNLRTDDNAIYSIPENMFAKTDYAALADYANMIYEGVCKKAVIKDGTTEFYCPEDITVETVEYNREFKTGMNALCLPFELEKNALNERLGGEKIDVLCTYDKETSDKFWFKRKAGVIAANTPVLLLAKEDFTLSFEGEVRMKKTPEKLTVIDEGDSQDPSKSYGLFMKANSTELQGATEYHKIYGLKKDGKFAPAASNKVNFPALRMVIYSNNTTESGVNAAPRHIGILDEKGVDITDQYTAVENVYTEASGITVTAGAGEINITSDADYGKVPVYTMDGKVAAMADVTAGTTTVSVQSGLYIVMGKKVIVK